MSQELLTIEEAADYLKVTPFTVRRYLREGKLPGLKVGGQWRIGRDDLTDKLRAGVVGVQNLSRINGRNLAYQTDFFDHKTLAQLIAEQGTQPLQSIESLRGDFWPEEEGPDEFIAQLRIWRDERDQESEEQR
jgi:excisionase family DNA binding protein